MAEPGFRLIKEDTSRDRLGELRDAVRKILEGNYLPNFTDHTRDHSDRLCELVDQLTSPLEMSSSLTDEEAFVLYAACYLHDVGMQHQRAGDTQVVQQVLQQKDYLGRRWEDLEEGTRRAIVRQKHHLLSGEMILQSVDAPQPVILGIQLTQEWRPGLIKCLCISHGLEFTDPEYNRLTQISGSVRMPLLSALLRIADILDESRKRSCLFLEKTRDLDLESQMHWWRHFYVSEVVIDPPTRQVTLWFDFPPDRRPQYRLLFMDLQVRWINTEFERQGAVLARHNLLWHLSTQETVSDQSTSIPMNEELERFIQEKLARQRQEQSEQDQLILVEQLNSARPTIQRALSDLRAQAGTMLPDLEMQSFCSLANHMWMVGGHRSAWILLYNEYTRLETALSLQVRFESAIALGKMMIQDGCTAEAIHLLDKLQSQVHFLACSSQLKFEYYRLLSSVFMRECDFDLAKGTLAKAEEIAPDLKSREEINAELNEMRFLLGDLSDLPDNLKTGNV